MMNTNQTRMGRTPLLRLAMAALVALPLAGCDTDSVLKVEDPDVIVPGAINSIEALGNVRAAAIGNFQVAYSGSSTVEGVIQYGGLVADEFAITESFNTRIIIDRRANREENSNNETVYRALARARTFGERAAAAYNRFSADLTTAQRSEHAEVLALTGYTYILFGENYCANGIPFAEIDDGGNVTPAPAISSDSVYKLALARFREAETALGAAATGTSAVARLIRVGKARAYLNLANELNSHFLDSAVAAIGGATGVPTTFVYNINHSTNSARQNNGIFEFNFNQRRWTVSNGTSRHPAPACPANRIDPAEPGGLEFRNFYNPGTDPNKPWDVRTPVFYRGVAGFDGVSCFFSQEKYPSQSAPVPLAEGKEARLIEAEAALRQGDAPGWLTIMNNLRGTNGLNACPSTLSQGCVTPNPATLPPLADPGDFDSRVQLHFRERALWLWLTAHRLGDLRRLIRQNFGLTEDDVFPTGPFVRGLAVGIYGNDVAMPVPFAERNNSAFNPASCNTTAP